MSQHHISRTIQTLATLATLATMATMATMAVATVAMSFGAWTSRVAWAQDSPAPEAAEAPRQGAIIDAELKKQDRRVGERGLTTPVAEPRSGAHLVWALLMVPEKMVEAMFLPIAVFAVVAERHQLPSRIDDALSNDAGTIVASPKLRISTGQGLGVGASLTLKSRLASEAQARFSGVIELDRDFELGAAVERRVANMEGRRVALSLEFERERGNDYFGVGDETVVEDRRELGIDDLRAGLDLDLTGRDADRISGTLSMGYLRQRLYPGAGTAAPQQADGDTTEAPVGFGEIRNLASLGFVVKHDSRDTEGRTSRGALIEADARFTLDAQDSSSNGVTATARGGLFIPLAGRRRTLVLSAGMGVAESPTGDSDSIPFDALIVLGRKNHLSGYARDRFHVTRAWWGRVEYRYPIWYLRKFPVVLTNRLFVDIGREGDSFDDLIDTPVRYSIGGGVILELYEEALAGMQLARSPEGLEFVFTAGSFL